MLKNVNLELTYFLIQKIKIIIIIKTNFLTYEYDIILLSLVSKNHYSSVSLDGVPYAIKHCNEKKRKK